jgi:diguanylate cyclase
LAESARRGDPLSLILARVGNLQGARDRDGVQANNEVLDAVGKLFIASVRAMDWVARFDMTTFAFLLPNTSHTNSLIVAERLLKTIATAKLSGGDGHIPLTLSIGTTGFVQGDSSESILCRAEEAMHAAAQSGGNCIQSELGHCETPCLV